MRGDLRAIIFLDLRYRLTRPTQKRGGASRPILHSQSIPAPPGFLIRSELVLSLLKGRSAFFPAISDAALDSGFLQLNCGAEGIYRG